jgi:hypothetical protein
LFLLACEQKTLDESLVKSVGSVESNHTVNDNEFSALSYIEHNEVYNPESVIPPQCYTKTSGDKNPCYVCHQTYIKDKERPNVMHDGALQGQYQFSVLGTKNHWKNLFVDRTKLINKISDEKIQDWITQDNYSDFIKKYKNNKAWQGEVTAIENLSFPDQAFDQQGIAKDGSHWIAYNYKPFPSTFWPTNGSTGDAMIRLPAAFRELNGVYSADVYFANLALVEMAVKDIDTLSTMVISEESIKEDLDGNGKVEPHIEQLIRRSHFVGDANTIELSRMLFPAGTEFLHTVRYIGVDDNGQVYNAPRMKEVRYMKKHNFKNKERLASSYYLESKEKNSEALPQTVYLKDKGINNTFGWTINAYIEDKKGELRQQNKQELAFCNGCHKTLGSTIDQIFSFPRKVEGAQGWGYIDLRKMADVPNIGEQQGEYQTYMDRVGGGDEFRQNKEMLTRWFNTDGSVNHGKVKQVKSIYELITPSARRALDLNKAYLTIVQEQSYLFGRDATLVEANNVLKEVDESQAPLTRENRYEWDMRLDWSFNDKKND